MANKKKDETGYSWQTLNPNGVPVQGNSKTWDGEHKWFNSETGKTGCAGANADRKEGKDKK